MWGEKGTRGDAGGVMPLRRRGSTLGVLPPGLWPRSGGMDGVHLQQTKPFGALWQAQSLGWRKGGMGLGGKLHELFWYFRRVCAPVSFLKEYLSVILAQLRKNQPVN